jgi:hypothetical protein
MHCACTAQALWKLQHTAALRVDERRLPWLPRPVRPEGGLQLCVHLCHDAPLLPLARSNSNHDFGAGLGGVAAAQGGAGSAAGGGALAALLRAANRGDGLHTLHFMGSAGR